jgi:hypothetical protein
LYGDVGSTKCSFANLQLITGSDFSLVNTNVIDHVTPMICKKKKKVTLMYVGNGEIRHVRNFSS